MKERLVGLSPMVGAARSSDAVLEPVGLLGIASAAVLIAASSPDTAVGADSAPQPVSSVAISIAAPVGVSGRILRFSMCWDSVQLLVLVYAPSLGERRHPPVESPSWWLAAVRRHQ